MDSKETVLICIEKVLRKKFSEGLCENGLESKITVVCIRCSTKIKIKYGALKNAMD